MTPSTTTRVSRAAAVLAALTAGATLCPSPAQAADAAPTVCVASFTATIIPGFTMTPSAGKLTSQGQTGSVDCFGQIAGHRITGPGTLGFTERHSRGSCRGHTGTGRVHLVIPTTAGDKDLVGTLAVRRTALTVRVRVRFPGIRYSGSGVIFPRMGDCATTPLEQIKVTLTGSLRKS